MSSTNVSRHPSGRLISSGKITSLEAGEVFVFGSNAAGKHRGGAARTAMDRFGAVYGQGHGLHGQSYAIDTMSGFDTIVSEVQSFLRFAGSHPELTFLVTEVGTGIAGHEPAQVAPLFREAPDNVALPAAFVQIELDEYRSAWTAELLRWTVDFLSLPAGLDSPNWSVPSGWRHVEPLWDEHDTHRTVVRLRQLLDDPEDAAVLGRYVYNGAPDWHLRRLLVRALFEQREDEHALSVARQLAGFHQMGGEWWEVQVVNLAEGRLAARRGQHREALDRFSTALNGPFRGAGWDPDLVLAGLCEIASLDTSWLGGDELAPSRTLWPLTPVRRRATLARLALAVAERVRPWRGAWYNAEIEAHLRDLAR